jgi:hypothetical protein
VAVKKLCSKGPTIEAAKFILKNKGAIVENVLTIGGGTELDRKRRMARPVL